MYSRSRGASGPVLVPRVVIVVLSIQKNLRVLVFVVDSVLVSSLHGIIANSTCRHSGAHIVEVRAVFVIFFLTDSGNEGTSVLGFG